MLLGDKLVRVEHLLELIESSSKMNHNLVKSDVLPKDRQNFASCQKIPNEAVFVGLGSIEESQATRMFLEVCFLRIGASY